MFISIAILISCVLGAAAVPKPAKRANPRGIDVSGFQGDVDWAKVASSGVEFAYVKATENSNFQNPHFAQQYNGAYKRGLIRGAYHFAIPNSKDTAAAQAKYFIAHGGGWSGDGKTLPGALDIEYNPYSGGTCYGLTSTAMVAWIKEFSDTYHSLTKRYPVIYTTTDWWTRCTGNSAAFGKTNPLWIARYSTTVGKLPAGWSVYSFWQYTDKTSVLRDDGDVWNGDSNYASAPEPSLGRERALEHTNL